MRPSKLPKPIRRVFYYLITSVERVLGIIRMIFRFATTGAIVGVVAVLSYFLLGFGYEVLQEYRAASEVRAGYAAMCSEEHELPSEILACRRIREGTPIFSGAVEGAWIATKKKIEDY